MTVGRTTIDPRTRPYSPSNHLRMSVTPQWELETQSDCLGAHGPDWIGDNRAPSIQRDGPCYLAVGVCGFASQEREFALRPGRMRHRSILLVRVWVALTARIGSIEALSAGLVLRLVRRRGRGPRYGRLDQRQRQHDPLDFRFDRSRLIAFRRGVARFLQKVPHSAATLRPSVTHRFSGRGFVIGRILRDMGNYREISISLPKNAFHKCRLITSLVLCFGITVTYLAEGLKRQRRGLLWKAWSTRR